MTVKYIKPRLTVFAFHLGRSLTKEKVDDADHLWERVSEIGNQLGIYEFNRLADSIESNIPSSNSSFEAILKKTKSEDGVVRFRTEYGLSGELFPSRLHDTLAMDLTFRMDDTDSDELSLLNSDKCLLPRSIGASLGQSWVFFSKVTAENTIDEDLAKTVLADLISNGRKIEADQNTEQDQMQPSNISSELPSLRGKGQFLGGSLFEFENDSYDPKSHYHVWIWLHSNEVTQVLESSGSYYYPLIFLLESRNKIYSVYHQAGMCYAEAKRCYGKLEFRMLEFRELKDQANLPSEQLEKLESWLRDLPITAFDFERWLRDMATHLSSIKTNVINYGLALKQLQQLFEPSDNLDFVEQFLIQDCQRFQEQIQIYLDNLSPGKELFYNFIAAIRGVVEVDAQKVQLANELKDKERDLNLQILFVAVGSGLAFSQISSSILDSPTQIILTELGLTPRVEYTRSWFGLRVIDVFAHLSLGILAGLLVQRALQKWSAGRIDQTK